MLNRRRHELTCMQGKWKCDLCGMELSRKQTLINHRVRCLRRQKKGLPQINEGNKDSLHRDTVAVTASHRIKVTPHTRSSYICGTCGKTFEALKGFQLHKSFHYRNATGGFSCNQCDKEFNNRRELVQHLSSHASGSKERKDPGSSFVQDKRLKCCNCSATFDNWHELYKHRVAHRNEAKEGHKVVHGLPWEADPDHNLPPWEGRTRDGEMTIDYEMKHIFEENRDTIRAAHDMGKVRGVYNFPLNDFNGDANELEEHVREIVETEVNAFRINVSFGVVLRNVETEEYRYYAAYYNSTVLDHPFYISKRQEMSGFLTALENKNLMEHIMKTRLSTKWEKIFVTNVTYFIYRTGFTFGHADGVTIPAYIRNKHCIRTLDKNRQRLPYQDNLCFFRCLAFSRGGDRDLEFRTKQLYAEWREHCETLGRTDLPLKSKLFKGVLKEDLYDLEHCFQTRINVYSLQPDDSCTLVYGASLDLGQNVTDEMYLNLYETHCSLIINFDTYAKKFSCNFCGRAFTRRDNLSTHQKVCNQRVNYVYPGGIFTPSQSVFEELEETFGVHVPQELQFYPWFAVFDFEAVLKRIPQDENDHATRWTTEHIPVCVSLASNIPGQETPYCIIDEDPDCLVKRMCEKLDEIQAVASKLARTRWESVLTELQRLKAEFPITPCATDGDENGNDCEEMDEIEEDLFGYGEDETVNIGMQDFDYERVSKLYSKRIDDFCKKFEKYISVLPVLGFNSSRYDLNLIKSRLPKHLNLAVEADYVVKKCNQYAAIATSKFIFLDISSYLAAGCSYSQFLKAYEVSSSKSYFPYEYFDDVAKLRESRLPPYEAFYSNLKGVNVLEAEYKSFLSSGAKGEPPPTGAEKYEELKQIWRDKGMKTLADFLEYYVNLDTGPFVEGADRLKEYYFGMNLDVFKISISAPGVARKLLFQHAKKDNIYFASFSQREADLYKKLRKNACGGPSIIFKRYVKVGETNVRNNPAKPCQSIHGYDCNSLYLWAIGENMPVLFPIRRFEETGFKPEVCWSHLDMFMWLNWMMKEQGIHIQHKLNSGREFAVPPFRLDGYSSQNGSNPKGFEYHGCWTHGHNPDICHFRKGKKTPDETKKVLAKREQYTKFRESYIRSRGIDLTVIYECQFAEMKKENPMIQSCVAEMLPDFYLSHPHRVRDRIILESVERGELTGMLEVDIRIPDQWPAGKERDMSPYDYFSEMSPIFCNSDVHFSNWGTTMQKYAFSKNSSEFSDSKKLLVGGMAAKKIFLSTHLLQWYLQKGLEVTHIYEVVEYKFQKCFESFCDFISDARRKGDSDISKEVLGQTCKVLGNAAYGSLLLDKTKHTNVKYVHEESQAHLKVNDPRFKTLVELPGDLYEIELSKQRIKLDIPIQVAFAILQLAKLKLLQFYYECLDYFVKREDFEITHCDTDSLYISFSGNDFTDVIRPSRKDEFQDGLYKHCSNSSFKASDGFWFPRRCCSVHSLYDRRSPGLFHLESSGNELVALASKTYFLRSNNGEDSIKAKGINKSALKNVDIVFRKTLQEQVSGTATNIGFRAVHNTIMTYEQSKRMCSFMYVKREVQSNGIDTKPLKIVLTPWEDYNVVVLKKAQHSLSNDFPCLLLKHGHMFTSSAQLFLYEKARMNGCYEIAEELLKCKKDESMYRVGSRIKVNETWYQQRDRVMMAIIQQKMANLKHQMLKELKQFKDRWVVQPGCISNNYWTCGLSERLAQVTPPTQYPGYDAMSNIWAKLSKNM